MDKRKGFTLIELIIILGVLAVVTGAIFIVVSGRNSTYRVIFTAANQLMSDIRYTRQRAIMEGEIVEIVFHGTAGRYTIRYRTGSTVIREGYLPDGVWFLHNNNRVYHFRPRGTPSGGFSIHLRSAHYGLTLSVVGSGGRVRISDFREVG